MRDHLFLWLVAVPCIVAQMFWDWLRGGMPNPFGAVSRGPGRCAHGADCKCYLGQMEGQVKHTERRR